MRRLYHRWIDKRTGYYRRRAELFEQERDNAVATLWLVRDAFAHVMAGAALDPGEFQQVIDTADRVLDRYLSSTRP